MPTIRQTKTFQGWLSRLRDDRALAKIGLRIDRLALGHAGDAKPVGSGVSELRIDHGPGYRLYLTRRGSDIVILLCGGDKASQDRDIRLARMLATQE